MNRREFLAALGAGAAISTLPSSLSLASAPQSPELITRLPSPYCAEPPAELLAEQWLTPVDRFFVLNHGAEPDVDASTYRLSVAGNVRRPLSLSYDQLRTEFPRVEVDATLMCAGNRRYEMHSVQEVEAIPLWRSQAVGTARWGGVLLSDVLRRAGAEHRHGHVHMSGCDRLKLKDTVMGFGGSIPLSRVAQGNPGRVLLAYEMNGQPLPRAHGFPVRAVVPGMIGARSIKWLTEVRVEREESDHPLFQGAHRLPGQDGKARPIYGFPVTTAILTQSEAITGEIRLRGYALVGGTDAIATVSVSIDGGRNWRRAKLLLPKARGCWRFWEVSVPHVPGAEVLARATTRSGAVTPASTDWNRNGYLYNAWSRTHLLPSSRAKDRLL